VVVEDPTAEEEAAAVKIQAGFKGMKARKELATWPATKDESSY